MKHKSQLIKAKVYNLGYCSEGIAKVIDEENNNLTVFIDNTTIGDVVEAETYAHSKNFLRASLKKIIQAGPSRVEPKCSLAKVCGGCQWQHIDYKSQLEAKRESVLDNLKKIAHLESDVVSAAIASPEIWNFRAKVQFPLSETNNSKRLLLGYYKKQSHEIVNIKYCPVHPEEFDHIIKAFRILQDRYHISIYNEKNKKGYLKHFIIRKSFASNEILLTFVVNSKQIDEQLKEIAEILKNKFPQVVGVMINFNTAKNNVIMGNTSELLLGQSHITETIGKMQYQISDISFFQVNPRSAELMFEYIYNLIKDSGRSHKLIDIYAGVAAIAIYVSTLFKEVIAIENAPSALKDANASFELNSVKNVHYINDNAQNVMANIENLSEFDWIILDPPRSGCEKEVLDSICNKTSAKIIYISCNPSTMSRDIKIIISYGYKVISIQPFDMFCHTYHIEVVVLLEKIS